MIKDTNQSENATSVQVKRINLKISSEKYILKLFYLPLLLWLNLACLSIGGDLQNHQAEESMTSFRSDGSRYLKSAIRYFQYAMIPGMVKTTETDKFFIEFKDVDRLSPTDLDKIEVHKWFEPEVIVTCRGKYSGRDIFTVKKFFKRLNKIIRQNRFVYKSDAKLANIVIEFVDRALSNLNRDLLGATMSLEDRLRVYFYKETDRIEIRTHYTRPNLHSYLTRNIRLTAAETEFVKENRLVKVYISNSLAPSLRKQTINHELFHAIGFPGHSPSGSSILYPMSGQFISYSGSVSSRRQISKLDLQLLEMLYRPDVLPSMTLREVSEYLATARSGVQLDQEQLNRYLTKKKIELLSEQTRLLSKSDLSFSQIESEHIIKSQLEAELNWLEDPDNPDKTPPERLRKLKTKIASVSAVYERFKAQKHRYLKRFRQIMRQLEYINGYLPRSANY